MKHITQSEFIKLIEDKQENAINALKFVSQQLSDREGMFAKALKEEKNKAYVESYEDLICYLKSVVIVPAQEYRETLFVNPLKVSNKGCVEENDQKTLFEKAPITPYVEPKVERVRNDRFREFEKINEDGCSVKELIDATTIQFIRFYDNKEHFEVEIWSKCGFVNMRTFIEEARAKAYYNELVEWWKYWKQN